MVLVVAAVSAWSARSGLLLLAARQGSLVVEDGARVHRLWMATLPAAVVAAALGGLTLVVPAGHTRFSVLVSGLLGVVVGAALSARDTRPRSARRTTRFRWLVVDTALPAGLIAAALGVSVAFLRLHSEAQVTPGILGRHLGATTVLYAVLLGLGGFAKAWSEQTAKLVVLPDHERATTPNAPGPLFVGVALGVAFIVVVPWVAPPLPLDVVLALKGALGMLLGGGLSLLGAVRGARAATLGKRRAD